VRLFVFVISRNNQISSKVQQGKKCGGGGFIEGCLCSFVSQEKRKQIRKRNKVKEFKIIEIQ